jgi:hypothetical protein
VITIIDKIAKMEKWQKMTIAVNKHLYINPMDINVAEVMQRCH